MIFQKSLDFSFDYDEGKMLLAAIAILTTISKEDIESGRFGGLSNPYSVLKEVTKLANLIYYEEEYNQYLKSVKRVDNIEEIMKA